MDAYAWYTINRESQDRFHDRLNEAEQWRLLQQVQLGNSRPQHRMLVIIANRLIATGYWLKAYASPVRVSQ
jgi:hypothetical protein